MKQKKSRVHLDKARIQSRDPTHLQRQDELARKIEEKNTSEQRLFDKRLRCLCCENGIFRRLEASVHRLRPLQCTSCSMQYATIKRSSLTINGALKMKEN